MKRTTLFLIASAAALSAVPATVSIAQPMQDDMTPEQRRPYVRMAAASDLFEIQSAQIALQKSRRAETRQFAQMLNRHHRQTTRQLMAAARTAGMKPVTPTLLPMQSDMLRELRRAS